MKPNPFLAFNDPQTHQYVLDLETRINTLEIALQDILDTLKSNKVITDQQIEGVIRARVSKRYDTGKQGPSEGPRDG